MVRERLEINPGDQFGYLTIVSENPITCKPSGGTYRSFRVQCICGKILKNRILSNLVYKPNVSCGCKRQSRRNLKHGKTDTPEYRVWDAMKQRCYNKNHKAYHYYGGRGIRIAKRWKYFENFIADMGRRPSDNHSIDRINNDEHYVPSNCRWATIEEQANNMSTNILLTFNVETKNCTQWARYYKFDRRELYRAMNNRERIEILERYEFLKQQKSI